MIRRNFPTARAVRLAAAASDILNSCAASSAGRFWKNRAELLLKVVDGRKKAA
jgi:hypothetical protein